MSDEFDITASQPDLPKPSSGAPAAMSSTSSTSPARFSAGDVLGGRYRIVTRLGRGGMGEVYRADDLRLDQPVALKFLPSEWIDDAERRERLRDEVRLARGVSHPRVCRVFDLDEIEHAGGRELCLAMELIDGEDLASLLSRIGRLAPEKATDIGTQICAGLAAIHKAGVVHCDLKPANIMIDADGSVRITDFGIAESVQAPGSAGGTPAYMAPERLAGRGATVAGDVYALGLVLYELYTGRKAFNATTVVELREKQEAGRVESMTSYAGDLDPAIERVVSRCLDAEPARRPASAAQVAMALPGGDPLQAALDAGETPSPELVAGAATGERLHPVLTTVIALVAVAVVTVFLAVSARFAASQFFPLDRQPIALADRAVQTLERLGIEVPTVDSGFGYEDTPTYRRWLLDQPDADASIWEAVRKPRPAYSYFWYRASPAVYDRQGNLGFARGWLEAGSPPWTIAGEVYVSLDLAGRLRRLYVVPDTKFELAEDRADAESPDVDEYDFGPAFAEAGLDIEAFDRVTPVYYHGTRADRRFAWSGVYPEQPDLALRVEAALTDGSLSYFRFVTPWELTAYADTNTEIGSTDDDASAGPIATPPSVLDGVRTLARTVLRHGPFIGMLLLIVIAAVMTDRNIDNRRIDFGGSIRLAILAAAGVVFAKFISTDRLWFNDQLEVIDCLAWGAFMGMGVWSAYAAVEPLIRRRYPRMLIGWKRLVDGHLADPAVGRAVLIGIAVGVAMGLAYRCGYLVQIRNDPAAPMNYWFRIPRINVVVIELIIKSVVSTISAFLYLVLLVGVRRVVKAEWLAFALWVPLIAMFNDHAWSYSWSWAIVLVASAVLAIVYVRAGVLAAITALFLSDLLLMLPVRADLSAWYAADTRLGLAAVAVMLAWAWWAASFGRTART